MRHNVKKIKFNFGRDANKMLLRKLAVNFLAKGYLQTTLTKAKTLKSHLEKLVTKMKIKSESNKNFLLKYLGKKEIVDDGFERVGLALSKIQGGCVKILKLGTRSSDGSLMAKVEWAHPVVKESASAEALADKEKLKVKKIKNEKPNKTDKTS